MKNEHASRKIIFTIIIPTRNSGKHLKDCLDSIEKNNFKDHEIIIADCQSKDNTRKIAHERKLEVMDVSFMSSGRARNIGACAAKGKYLIFLDSDVILDEFWFRNLKKAINAKGRDIIIGRYSGPANKNNISMFAYQELAVRRPGKSGFVNSFPSNNFVIRKEAFKSLGGFTESENFHAEDLEFSINACKKFKAYQDNSLEVRHHFPNTFFGYLTQQYRFSRDGIIVYIRNGWTKNLFKLERTYQGDLTKVKIAATALLMISLLAVPALGACLLLFIYTIEFELFNKILKEKELNCLVTSALLVPSRNLTWLIGASTGILKYFIGKEAL